MNEKELLPFCRYYKGGANNPYNSKSQNKAMFWDYEKQWLEITIDAAKHPEGQSASILKSALEDYLDAGLRDFEQMDDTPTTLKAILFNRYGYWLGGRGLIEDAKHFKEFYSKEYINGGA